MKLELKDISKHLPYGVKVWDDDELNILSISMHHTSYTTTCVSLSAIITYPFGRFKPTLRPLSDLTKEIVHKGERFVPIGKLNEIYGSDYFETRIIVVPDVKHFTIALRQSGTGYYALPLEAYQTLLSWNFDVDNLIEKGLAIDVNTLNENCYG